MPFGGLSDRDCQNGAGPSGPCNQSPMPFGGLSDRDPGTSQAGNRSRTRHQCLSAVCLIGTCLGEVQGAGGSGGHQCLSAVCLIGTSLLGCRLPLACDGHQCLSAVCLIGTRRAIRKRPAPSRVSPMPFGGLSDRDRRLLGFSVIHLTSHQCLSAVCLIGTRNACLYTMQWPPVTNAFRRFV